MGLTPRRGSNLELTISQLLKGDTSAGESRGSTLRLPDDPSTFSIITQPESWIITGVPIPDMAGGLIYHHLELYKNPLPPMTFSKLVSYAMEAARGIEQPIPATGLQLYGLMEFLAYHTENDPARASPNAHAAGQELNPLPEASTAPEAHPSSDTSTAPNDHIGAIPAASPSSSPQGTTILSREPSLSPPDPLQLIASSNPLVRIRFAISRMLTLGVWTYTQIRYASSNPSSHSPLSRQRTAEPSMVTHGDGVRSSYAVGETVLHGASGPILNPDLWPLGCHVLLGREKADIITATFKHYNGEQEVSIKRLPEPEGSMFSGGLSAAPVGQALGVGPNPQFGLYITSTGINAVEPFENQHPSVGIRVLYPTVNPNDPTNSTLNTLLNAPLVPPGSVSPIVSSQATSVLDTLAKLKKRQPP